MPPDSSRPDPETIAVYDTQANAYADMIADLLPEGPDLVAFIGAMPAGASVLDLGCGPGTMAAKMRDAGLRVTATDASVEMVRLAKDRYGITAQQASFSDLSAEETYDGIWANFSLLHETRAAFPGVLARLKRALKPDGLLHLGMKTGEGETRDSLGRFYTYYTEAALLQALEHAGFRPEVKRRGHAKGLSGSNDPFAILWAHG